MGKFEIKKTKNDGFMFNLKAGNGEVIATSETYNSLDACKNGINSVITNAPEAPVEDQTVEGYATEKNPKFELYADKKGEFRFRLKAKNGQIIAARATRLRQAARTASRASRKMLLTRRLLRLKTSNFSSNHT